MHLRRKPVFLQFKGNRMNLTVEYLTILITLFTVVCINKSTKILRSFWSSDCSVLPLLLKSFSMLRKVAFQSTMREHLLVYFK